MTRSVRCLFASSSLASSSAADIMNPWLAREFTFAMSGALSEASASLKLSACSAAASALLLFSGERGVGPSDFKMLYSYVILESDF